MAILSSSAVTDRHLGFPLWAKLSWELAQVQLCMRMDLLALWLQKTVNLTPLLPGKTWPLHYNSKM